MWGRQSHALKLEKIRAASRLSGPVIFFVFGEADQKVGSPARLPAPHYSDFRADAA
jgi:hypothetical protein